MIYTTYRITKLHIDGRVIDYGGGHSEADVKDITQGYTFDGLMYNRKGSGWFFMVTPEHEVY